MYSFENYLNENVNNSLFKKLVNKYAKEFKLEILHVSNKEFHVENKQCEMKCNVENFVYIDKVKNKEYKINKTNPLLQYKQVENNLIYYAGVFAGMWIFTHYDIKDIKKVYDNSGGELINDDFTNGTLSVELFNDWTMTFYFKPKSTKHTYDNDMYVFDDMPDINYFDVEYAGDLVKSYKRDINKYFDVDDVITKAIGDDWALAEEINSDIHDDMRRNPNNYLPSGMKSSRWS